MQMLRRFAPTLLIFILGVSLGVGGLLILQFVKGPKQTVSVIGEGVVEAVADQASLNVQITNTAPTLQGAKDATKKDVQELKMALRKLGIPENQIVENSDSYPMEIMIKRVPQENTSYANLQITLTNITAIEKVFAVIQAQKHAQITSSDYSLKSAAKYESAAREKALIDARSQVEVIAKINKLHVGKLVSITDTLRQDLIRSTKGVMMDYAQESPAQQSYGEKTVPISASFRAVYEIY